MSQDFGLISDFVNNSESLKFGYFIVQYIPIVSKKIDVILFFRDASSSDIPSNITPKV